MVGNRALKVGEDTRMRRKKSPACIEATMICLRFSWRRASGDMLQKEKWAGSWRVLNIS
jgi:hypothetical protein